MVKNFMLFLILFGLAAAGYAVDPIKMAPSLDKKLIEYGWDVPTPDFIRAHIKDMEQRPFDGIIFRLKAGTNVLEPKAWDEAAFAADYDNLANTAWSKFTDNFVSMLAASNQDWFDDGQWAAIEKNVVLVAKAGKIGKCVGICFDPEPYGENPWDYSKAAHKDTKPFPEYTAKVRERGAQFIKAIEKEMPAPKILTFYLLALFGQYCEPMNPDERAAKLAGHPYALYPAFINGILDASSPGVTLTDGNESAYYYTDSAQYFEVYQLIKQRALYLVDTGLWPKFQSQVQVGQALYMDQYFGLRADKVLGNYMTPKEQPKWFEHNVYWALNSSDHYVWCYSERMNWWKNEGVPTGAEDAIKSAKEKVAKGQPLGLNIAPIVKAATKREHGEVDKE